MWRWVGAAALARALPVRRLLEQQEPELQEPQKQTRQEPELQERPVQEPELRGVAQHYRKKK